MANSYLNKTQSAGNRTNWTLSAWVKRSALGTAQCIMSNYSGSNYCYLQINPDNKMRFLDYSSGNNCNKITTRLFRDTNSWYHVVIAIDTTDGTAEDRFKLYINGERETAFDTSANFSSSFNTNMNVSGHTSVFGVNQEGNASYWNGYMSHVALVDGATLAPTVFGETDSTSGIWKFKSPSGVTWGTNGFHLKFENSGNLGLDSSGQSNTFTVNGNGRQALDTPSNVYATMNPLDNFYANATLSNGNTTVATNATNETYITSTLAVSTGKYYWEVEYDAGSDNSFIGIIDRVSDSSSFQAYMDATNGISYKKNGSIYTNGGNMSGVNIGTYTTGDIISVAMDLDNNKLYFGKNGTWLNSGVPTSGSTGTGAFSINSSPKDGVYYAQVGDDNTGSQTLKCNFGNGYFGTTAISSAGSNGNGSLFEYDVPSGYYALNTKNINTYG